MTFKGRKVRRYGTRIVYSQFITTAIKMQGVFTIVAVLLLLGNGQGFHRPLSNRRNEDVSLAAQPTTTKDGITKKSSTEESLRSAIAPSTYKVGEIKVNMNAAKKRELAAIDARKRMEAIMNGRSLQRNQLSLETTSVVVEELMIDKIAVTGNVPQMKEFAAKEETPKVLTTKRNYGLSSGYKKGSLSSGNYHN